MAPTDPHQTAQTEEERTTRGVPGTCATCGAALRVHVRAVALCPYCGATLPPVRDDPRRQHTRDRRRKGPL